MESTYHTIDPKTGAILAHMPAVLRCFAVPQGSHEFLLVGYTQTFSRPPRSNVELDFLGQIGSPRRTDRLLSAN
jgi:hypothetical protein